MSNPEGVRAITCPSCGAQIHVAEGSYRTTCEYCGALLELPHPTQPENTPIVIVTQGSRVAKPSSPANPPQRRAGMPVLVIALVMLCVVGGLSFVIVQALDKGNLNAISSVINSYRASTPALILPGADGGPADAVIYTYDNLKDTRFLTYLDGTTHQMRWQTDPLGDDSYRVVVAVNENLVLTALGTDVTAYNRASGSVVWRASVSDEPPSSCPSGCLRVVGQRVIVLSKDGRLTGLDLESGRVVWNVRLESTPDQFFVAGDEVGIFDRRDSTVMLLLLNAADGSEQHTVSPLCSDSSSPMTDDPDLDSPVLVSQDQQSVVIVYGFFNVCAQRWNVASGTMMWNAFMGDLSYQSVFDPAPVLSGDSIYLAAGNQLVRIGLADGKWGVLLEDPDYEFVPLEARGGVLITRAKRTRGSTRFELWGIDLETGQQVWQHPLPGSEPLDGPDSMSGLIDKGDAAWTAHLVASGLALITATADPHQLTVERLDPASGTSTGQAVIPLSGISGDFYSAPDIVGWYRDQLWMVVEGRMLVVDPEKAALAFSWP